MAVNECAIGETSSGVQGPPAASTRVSIRRLETRRPRQETLQQRLHRLARQREYNQRRRRASAIEDVTISREQNEQETSRRDEGSRGGAPAANRLGNTASEIEEPNGNASAIDYAVMGREGQDQASPSSTAFGGRRIWSVHTPAQHSNARGLPVANSMDSRAHHQCSTEYRHEAGISRDLESTVTDGRSGGQGNADAAASHPPEGLETSPRTDHGRGVRSSHETPDQRQRRLAWQREYNRRRRSATAGSLSEPGEVGDMQRLQESFAQRQNRLTRQRVYNQRRRQTVASDFADSSGILGLVPTAETPDQRQHRLARQREYDQSRRLSTQRDLGDGGNEIGLPIRRETLHQQQHRLARQREYNKRRRRAEEDDEDIEASMHHRESESERELRLRSQRAYHQQRSDSPQQHVERSSIPALQLASTQEDNMASSLESIAEDAIGRIEARLQESLGAHGLDECVCGVCDRLCIRSTCQRERTVDSKVFACMQRVLQAPTENISPAILAYYSCEDMDDELSGMMLSRKGVEAAEIGVEIKVCRECYGSLLKGGDSPPKYAIANGFFMGVLPRELAGATWMERVMTQLVTVVAQTRVMRGGRHRAIRSHCMVFDSTPGPVATMLPRRVDRDGSYRVVLAGPMTEQQNDRVRKLHQVRGKMVGELLAFYTSNNAFYADVNVDRESVRTLDQDATMFDNICIEHEETDAGSTIDEEQESIVGRSDSVSVPDAQDECSLIEHNVLLAEEEVVPDASFVQRVVDMNAHEPLTTPRLRVHHSSRFASSVDIEARMYPHLFPFGRGHPSENRKVHVARRDCIKYYSMLSSRRFAQDPTFMLTAFARLSLENMYTLTSVKCRRLSSPFNGYEALSSDDLAAALVNNERRQRGQPRQEPVNPTAERFLKSVELGSVSVWGSSAERRQCRQEAFAYQTRFGQPSLFVTLTPNTDNSYAMAHYTGILSVDTLFDAIEARTPSVTEMKTAAMKDDCASARLFMRNIDAFITDVLGIDSKSGQSSERDGRFGRTKAYFGMVETQGRGTLHIHFLIWLFGTPVNSAAFERCLVERGGEFQEQLTRYIDSIVTTKLPLPVEQTRCSKCNAAGTFRPLSIPSSSRIERRRRDHQSTSTSEPLLVECSFCLQKSSAQHILRQVLLQHRPPHWPPPLAPLSKEQTASRIEKEAVCRSSIVEAANVIRAREMYYASMESDHVDQFSDWLLHINDSTQKRGSAFDDDPVKSDAMSRLIEMLPASSDTDRMAPTHRAYMMSSLVVNLNVHSWAHTGSCFKSSRSTRSASSCRYGYPRERATDSSVDGPKVILKRAVAHEYINGYNSTIMAMFKCNHDVQVLFGGHDAINRIYYCCKYVTKPQRQIDSTTAVALASFQRRQAKEAVEAASDAPPTLTDVRRRRVTSMVHTFTNKQEIAGPLAALYLLRGSCCYSSHTCVRLPLSDVMKQLDRNGDYSCSLVRTASNEHTMYMSASYLDDYIHRPDSTEEASLYEFTMQCYRRNVGKSTAAKHRFREEHPLATSHCIGYRKRHAVPIISGPRLPRLADEMDTEQREKYSKIALVLFKPFRSLGDLRAETSADPQPWYSAYRSWDSERSEFVKTVMANMDDYHRARVAESEAVLDVQERDEEAYSFSSDGDASDDGYLSSDLDAEPGDDVDHLFDWERDDSSGLEESVHVFPAPATFPSNIQGVLEVFDQHGLVENIARDVVSSCARFPSVGVIDVTQLRKWVDNADFDSSERETDAATVRVPLDGDERPTTVNEIVDDVLSPEQLIWEASSSLSSACPDLPDYSGVRAVSRHFTLNELQHGAFVVIAMSLLHRWRTTPDLLHINSDEELQGRQLLMYLGGEGGTGKSRVIHAVQQLCQSWQRPRAIVLSAMTGKAASLIGGRTLASFEMALRSPNSRSSLQDVDCLIVDEVSMMSKDQLLRLDRLLRKAKRIKSVPFGGIHVILVGDFLQLPPVGADPLFTDPSTKTKASISDFEGFWLWRKFNKVVILRESVRFREDPEWGEGCSKARYGEWTPTFVRMINARVISNSSPISSQNAQPAVQTVFVTPDNATRTAINGHFIASAARLLPQGGFPIRIVANFKGVLAKLSTEDVSFIMGLPDSKFGRMAPYLDLLVGMPIQITQNIRTKKGVANGTMGFLHSVQFPPDVSFRRVLDRRTGAVVLLPSQRPLYALVQLDRDINPLPIADGLDPTLFPVFPDAEAFSKTSISLTPSSKGEPRSLSVKIQQFPFVCAMGATVYKVQGESLRSMAVVDWKVSASRANRPQQAYLMVSRVVRRDGLLCLKPFTTAIAEWAKPPTAAIEEERRLAQESESTLRRFYESQVANREL